MTTTDLSLDSNSRAGAKSLLRPDERPPVLLVAGIVAVALVWNLFAGLRFSVPLGLVLLAPLPCFALFAFYRLARREERIAESALYLGLWLVYPAFGAELVYLVTTLDFPLRDSSFFAADRALGFDWMGWARFVLGHPVFKAVGDIAYSSNFWQPLAGIFLFAFRGPKGRNGEFLVSVMLGLLATITLYTLFPTLGPADMNHVAAEQGRIIRSLRGAFLGPYSYVGIISFPSFHTVMAILFTLAFRGNRVLFVLFGIF